MSSISTMCYRLLIVPTFLSLFTPPLFAESDPPETFVSLQMENDFFASSGDRYYTHGTQLSVLKREEPPEGLSRLAEWVPFYEQGEQLSLVNYTFGQKIFTPDETEGTSVVEDDRPYAGYLYASVAVLSQISSSDQVDYGNMFDITIGIVGPSAMGEQAQTGFHDLVGIDSPEGWDNQLEDELAIGLSYSRFWRLVRPISQGLELGVAPHMTMVVGNAYTYGAGGVMFRLGDGLKRDLNPPNIRPGFPGLAYFRQGAEPSWYLFLGFETRLIARNIFLDGNTFKDSHSVEKENLVGDMQFGLVYLFDRWRLSFSNMLRTKEFTTQENNTHYGAVNITYGF
ncbi:MAG: lipid A deacylase LpxR family protein [Gammaproteobacteria bacterium]|nr:lipid A deacylase LpxR family protein [Gammaproteobacteria bacterium]MCW8839707.1 lipid A deacylase LpxR family protein [Gammaproteobacteria bacterium]MCW8927876.1 lipid A deacylase LpxR family protein [Gammaproteobacteria bacterium]MCW8959645.1 lipid A deacylase LpxR family protein [Gammaproteobacteria bacterium]MCW8972463.1 lipid A deacylase LpxR family protein [Gammaproteobacteria bacterium]